MKLKTVEIFDYKSIKHEIVELNGHQHCFVGKNECGKSSIIQAISHLNFLDTELPNTLINKGSNRYPSGFPVISGVFHLQPESYKSLSRLLRDHSSETDAGVLPSESESCFIQMKRWGNGISNLSILMSDKENFQFDILKSVKNPVEFIDVFQKEIYPTIEYYEKEDLLIEPATIDDLKGSDKKFETFRRLLFLGDCNDLKC